MADHGPPSSSVRCDILKDWSGGHRLYVVRDRFDKERIAGSVQTQVANGFTWVDHLEGDMWDASFDGIPRADELIQKILDAAWNAGFRPSGFSDVKNETAALKEHLTDMRTIAFHQLGIKAEA
jgi:hypothetical protein